MVFNPQLYQEEQLITAVLVADLTSAQLDTVQEKFGIGAFLSSPFPAEQLFIYDKRSWSSWSHAEMKREYADATPLLIIDDETANDGGLWYAERFASQDEVDDGVASSTDTLLKIRMKIEEVVITKQNYDISNTDITEDMDNIGISVPIPEDFDFYAQDGLYSSGLDYDKDRYIGGTYIVAEPGEYEESTDEKDGQNYAPMPDVVTRLKEHVAKENAMQHKWSVASDVKRDRRLPDGTLKKFPLGSKNFRCDYDRETVVPIYKRPDGSL